MANRTLNMVKLKRAFQMLSASTPQREICAQLHIGRGVLNRYKKLADEAKVDYGTIGRISAIEPMVQLRVLQLQERIDTQCVFIGHPEIALYGCGTHRVHFGHLSNR